MLKVGDNIFKLGSDTIDNASFTIEDIYKDINGDDGGIYNYGYEEFDEVGTDANQILINSDRITLNTKLNKIPTGIKKPRTRGIIQTQRQSIDFPRDTRTGINGKL